MPAYKDSKTGTWFVKFYCKDWTGENKQIKKRGFATKREALDYERNYKIRQENNLDMTFGEFWKLYTEDVKNYVKLNTWLTKEHIVDTKILPYFKNLKMNEITPGDVRKWQNEMVAFRNENGKSYSQTYKKTMHNILSAIFNHACRFYNLKSNPARQAGNMGREEKKEMLFWTTEEYKKFSETLSVILQDKLRAEASYGFECYFKEQLAEKKKGRNHDLSVTEYKVAQESRKLADIKQRNNEEQEKNTKLRSNNASISYQIATQEQRHSRNLDVIAADEDRLETVRSSINVAETEYAKYEDMITDKKNNLELLSSKESELIEKTKIAESVYDLFRQGGTDDVRDKLIDVMYENQKLKEENITLKKLLEKAYGFMKQFVIDGVNLLERYWESVGKVIGKIR